TVTDMNGCSQSSSVDISQPEVLSTSILSSTNTSCVGNNNGSATASVTGGTSPYNYSWSPSGGATAAASGLAAGNYTVTVTDAQHCSQSASVSILQPDAIAIIPFASDVSCFGGINGSASILVSGGTLPYSYLWSTTGDTTSTASDLPVGNYPVTVTDANNCVQSSSVSISQ